MIGRHVPDRSERLRCYASVIAWLLVDWRVVRLLFEAIAAPSRRARAGASALGQCLLGTQRAVRAGVIELRPRHR